jgi:hypothetical protein
MLSALFVWSVALPASAQGVTALRLRDAVEGPAAGTASNPQVKPDLVVARLMSFDRNHDGLVTRAELPERMQMLLARGDAARDDALNAENVQRLAEHPAPQVVLRGFEPGHYGFGDDTGFDFDSRLHIEGAIDDLRLASVTRERALGIGRQFADAAKARARTDLLAVATAALTPEQLAAFTAALEREPALPDIKANVQNAEALRMSLANAAAKVRQTNATRLVAQFPLEPDDKQQLLAALDQYKEHQRLNETERSALLDQLHSLLTDQERDDLRAALERRPIVKQGASIVSIVM